MKKVVGYVVSIVGIIVMVFGFEMFPIELDILKGVAGNIIVGVGIVGIVVGVLISLKDGGGRRNNKKGEDEIPIYEGVGKKRRVVGYRKD